jgi:hypothetical protein
MKKPTLASTPVVARLDKHFAGCSAAAVGVASFFAHSTPAEAGIVYSGIQNVPIFPGTVNGGVYINVEPPFNFAQGSRPGGWDLNPYYTGWSVYVNANTKILLTGAYPTALTFGDLIGPSGTWSGAGWSGDSGIATGSTGYIGFSFDPDDVPGAQEYYGWFQMHVGNNNTINGSVIDWAYENTGAPIATGMVPEPSSFAILAMGAAGLLMLRERRAAAAK